MDQGNRNDGVRGADGFETGRARRMDFRDNMPVGNDPASIRKRIEAMEAVLERAFVIPGVNYRVGLDSVVGLVPVIGDVITAAMGAYIVWEARNLGIPKWKLWRMAANIGFDTAVGAIPVVGDAFDLLFRSNTKNLKIIKKHLDKHHPESRVIEG
ncbi:hypothetical protein GCM10010989_03740 [Croceicoccus pelagius]|uniref:DUF4112 domain-containing protein n=2 Tax=Croceicoccus pelagius TaxID=1703341 RepID=A0A917DF95_9SPHN|nr:hypothetical protein GCM10010989_03740 [Croceicoccus pelagius]